MIFILLYNNLYNKYIYFMNLNEYYLININDFVDIKNIIVDKYDFTYTEYDYIPFTFNFLVKYNNIFYDELIDSYYYEFTILKYFEIVKNDKEKQLLKTLNNIYNYNDEEFKNMKYLIKNNNLSKIKIYKNYVDDKIFQFTFENYKDNIKLFINNTNILFDSFDNISNESDFIYDDNYEKVYVYNYKPKIHIIFEKIKTKIILPEEIKNIIINYYF